MSRITGTFTDSIFYYGDIEYVKLHDIEYIWYATVLLGENLQSIVKHLA